MISSIPSTDNTKTPGAIFEATASWFPDPRGPALYAGGTLLAGLDYEL